MDTFLHPVDGHIGKPLLRYTWWRWTSNLGKLGYREPKWCCGVIVEAARPRWLHPTSILDTSTFVKCLSTFICYGWAYGCTLTLLYLQRWMPNSKFREIGLWGARMTLWCHGWGCKTPMTGSYINIGGTYGVWASSQAMDGHMCAPLNCYTFDGGSQI